jgi:hypothetical protein
MTVRISSFQSSPATTFELEADVAGVDPSYGSHGRWRVRFYLRAENGPGGSSGSGYFGSGTQIGRYGNSNSEFGRRSGNPFLPSGVANGAQRWRVGPFDEYVNANSDGFYSGGSSSLPLRMDLDYGSVDVSPASAFVMGRIAREPGKSPTPSLSVVSATSITATWSAAERGNDDIDNYQIQMAENSSFTDAATASAGTDRSYTSVSRTPGTKVYVRVRAHNGDGYGYAWCTDVLQRQHYFCGCDMVRTFWFRFGLRSPVLNKLFDVGCSDGRPWHVSHLHVDGPHPWGYLLRPGSR